MRNYDVEQETRVWDRVMGGTPPAIPADALTALDGRLRGMSRMYAQLSRRQPRLRSMARQSSRDADRLGAMVFLLTGRRPPREKPKPQRVGRLPDALRRQYREERSVARDCEAYAQRGGEFADDLREIARHANSRARELMRLL